MTKFTGTIGRKKINDRVAHHLFEALTWCFPKSLKKGHYAKVKNANTHDEMVEAVRQICREMSDAK